MLQPAPRLSEPGMDNAAVMGIHLLARTPIVCDVVPGRGRQRVAGFDSDCRRHKINRDLDVRFMPGSDIDPVDCAGAAGPVAVSTYSPWGNPVKRYRPPRAVMVCTWRL